MPKATVRTVLGDITEVGTDAIVNAANPQLAPGGGVCGAIHRAAGPGLAQECRAAGGCPTGQARITGGYDLPARHVIHAVGPVYRGGDDGEPQELAGAYETSLRLADAHGLRSIAFPALSAGIYGYPLEQAADIAVGTVLRVLPETSLNEVVFVLFDEPTRAVFDRALADHSGGN